jgi:hypothetical protein
MTIDETIAELERVAAAEDSGDWSEFAASCLAAINGLIASRDEARRERERLGELAGLGRQLSIWAGAIKWDQGETNTREWLDGLRVRIDRFQAAYGPIWSVRPEWMSSTPEAQPPLSEAR